MNRRELPRGRNRHHEDILDDEDELSYDDIKDYEEALPRPGRGSDHQLGGLGERSYRAAHIAAGRAGGATGHPLAEKQQDCDCVRPPRGPHSAMDQDDVLEEELEDIDECMTLLEVDLDILTGTSP